MPNKIFHEYIADSIDLTLDDGSVLNMYPAGVLKKRLPSNIPYPIYWLSRIKVVTTKIGNGTFLMQRACEIADEKRFAILLRINPYGDLTFRELKSFYEKHGFKTCSSTSLLLRTPI